MAPYSTKLNNITLCYIELSYSTKLNNTILCYIEQPYSTKLNNTTLCYIVLNYIVLPFLKSTSFVLYCTMLYYIVFLYASFKKIKYIYKTTLTFIFEYI